jgi:hypothetical protein
MAHFRLRVSGSVCDKHGRRVALGACCTPLFAVKSQIATSTMVATRALRRRQRAGAAIYSVDG